MIVRELLAKFGFEVDTSKAEQFKKTINDVKLAIGTIAVGKLNQWANELEVGFQRANRQLQALTDSEGFQLLQQGVQRNSDQFGLSKKSLLDASNAFVEITSNAKLANSVMDEASRLSTIYAQAPKDVMAVFGEFVASGATEGMKELGLLTHQQLETLRISGREYGVWTTKARETELINLLLSKSEKHQKLYNLALKDSGIQTFLLREQFKEWSKGIGEFLNPAIAKTVGYLNDVFKNFRDSEIGKTTTKILTIGGSFLAVVSAMALAEKGLGLFLKMFTGNFGKLTLAAFLLTAIALVAEDIWTYLTDPDAETWVGTLAKEYPTVKEWLEDLQEVIKDFNWKDFKEGLKIQLDEMSPMLRKWVDETEKMIKDFKWSDFTLGLRLYWEEFEVWFADKFKAWKAAYYIIKYVYGGLDSKEEPTREPSGNAKRAGGIPRVTGQQILKMSDIFTDPVQQFLYDTARANRTGIPSLEPRMSPAIPAWTPLYQQSVAPKAEVNVTVYGGNPQDVTNAVKKGMVESGYQADLKSTMRKNVILNNAMKRGGH